MHKDSYLLEADISIEVPCRVVPVGGSLADGDAPELLHDHVPDEVQGTLPGRQSRLIDLIEFQSTKQKLYGSSREAVRPRLDHCEPHFLDYGSSVSSCVIGCAIIENY